MVSKNRKAMPGIAIISAMPLYALALTPMDDAGLSQVNGRDGLTLNYESASGISAQSVGWETDAGTDQEANTQLKNLNWSGVNGNPLSAEVKLDVGSTADPDGAGPLQGEPRLALSATWQPMKFTMGSMGFETKTSLSGAPAIDYSSRSMGQAAFYSSGNLSVVNQGIFYSDGTNNKAVLDFALTGDWIYRQGDAGSAEMSLGNLEFTNTFTTGAANAVGGTHQAGTGTIGIDSNGILVSSPFTYSKLQFDLMYKDAHSGNNFDRDGRTPMMHAGWIGGLANTLVRLDPVGINSTQGLTALAQWDFDSDFILNLGHATDGDGTNDNDTQLQLRNWRTLGSSPSPMLKMNASLDVLQDGAGTGGLCFGETGTSCTGIIDTTVPVGESAFAIMMRDSHLHAYSQNIAVDSLGNIGTAAEYDWSVILTMGLLEADILVYPGGAGFGGPIPEGFRMDAAVMVQSPGYWSAAMAGDVNAASNWATNTHFLLADTASDTAIGLMNADILWQAKNFYVMVGAEDPTHPELGTGGTSDSAIILGNNGPSTYRVRGLFGAGKPSNLNQDVAKAALWDLKLSTNQFRFALYPTVSDGSEALGFDGFLNLDGNAYLSLAEVSEPASAFRLYDVGGSIAWKNGSVTLHSEAQNTGTNGNGDGLASLTLKNELYIGESAVFATPDVNGDYAAGVVVGDPLVGKIGFGDQYYGQIAMPAGQWKSEVIAKIPQ